MIAANQSFAFANTPQMEALLLRGTANTKKKRTALFIEGKDALELMN